MGGKDVHIYIIWHTYHESHSLLDDVDISPGLGDVDGVHCLQHGQSAVLTLVQQAQELVEVDFGRIQFICFRIHGTTNELLERMY